MPTAAKNRAGKRNVAPKNIADEITDIALKAIQELDPMEMWEFYSLELMRINDWTEEDLKVEVDKLLLSSPPMPVRRTGKPKSSKKQLGRKGHS